MPEPRTFVTLGQYEAGGVESEALGLPFKSTPCEDWYGWGDQRCPSRYIETGDLETDIISLKKWIGLYSLRGKAGFNLEDKLRRKQAELEAISQPQISEEQFQQEQRLVNIDKIIVTLESQLLEREKTLAGFHPQHYIRQSIEAQIKQLKEKIIQKKTRN